MRRWLSLIVLGAALVAGSAPADAYGWYGPGYRGYHGYYGHPFYGPSGFRGYYPRFGYRGYPRYGYAYPYRYGYRYPPIPGPYVYIP